MAAPKFQKGDKVNVRNKGPGEVTEVRESELPHPHMIAVKLDSNPPGGALWESENDCTAQEQQRQGQGQQGQGQQEPFGNAGNVIHNDAGNRPPSP